METYNSKQKSISVNEIIEESKSKPLVAFILSEVSGASYILETYFEELADECEEWATFLKIKEQHSYKLINELDIEKLPCLLFFKEGKLINQLVKLQSKKKLKRKIHSSFL